MNVKCMHVVRSKRSDGGDVRLDDGAGVRRVERAVRDGLRMAARAHTHGGRLLGTRCTGARL